MDKLVFKKSLWVIKNVKLTCGEQASTDWIQATLESRHFHFKYTMFNDDRKLQFGVELKHGLGANMMTAQFLLGDQEIQEYIIVGNGIVASCGLEHDDIVGLINNGRLEVKVKIFIFSYPPDDLEEWASVSSTKHEKIVEKCSDKEFRDLTVSVLKKYSSLYNAFQDEGENFKIDVSCNTMRVLQEFLRCGNVYCLNDFTAMSELLSLEEKYEFSALKKAIESALRTGIDIDLDTFDLIKVYLLSKKFKLYNLKAFCLVKFLSNYDEFKYKISSEIAVDLLDVTMNDYHILVTSLPSRPSHLMLKFKKFKNFLVLIGTILLWLILNSLK